MMFDVARCKRTGFTLIEIMIVIAIIAILAGIAIPNIREARAEAQLQACKQNILKIVNSMQMAMIKFSSVKSLVDKINGFEIIHGNGELANADLIWEFLYENGYAEPQTLPICRGTGNGYKIVLSFEGTKGFCDVGCSSAKIYALRKSTAQHIVGGQAIAPWYRVRFAGGGSYGWMDHPFSADY